MSTDRRIAVIGHGMAGSRLVSELLDRDPGLRITVYGEEAHPAYNRILLADVLAGGRRADRIRLPERHQGADVRTGVAVTAIDRSGRVITGSDKSRTRYDALVLATGSSPVLPPLRGLRDGRGELRRGVFSFRTLDDCEDLLAAVPGARRAVVIGGGLLGVAASRALAQRGLPVELVHQAPYLMERNLDRPAAAVLYRRLAALGVTAYLECRARAVVGTRSDPYAVGGVELAGRQLLDCDLVVIACGTRPRVRLARESGLAVARGVLVDDRLRSIADPAVHAIGDCAEHRGRVYGFVEPAWEQAAVLAGVLTGAPAEYRGSRPVTRLAVAGIDVIAFGEAQAVAGGVEVIRAGDAAAGMYRKLVKRGQAVVGGILIGGPAARTPPSVTGSTMSR